jgi:hypothetical protein
MPQPAAAAAAAAALTLLTWPAPAQRVVVTGDMTAWSTEGWPLTQGADGAFSGAFALPPGTRLKFIADGEWRHSSALPTTEDGHGGWNNVIH